MTAKKATREKRSKKETGNYSSTDDKESSLKPVILFVGPAPESLREWIKEKKKNLDEFEYFNLQSADASKDKIEKAKEAFDKVLICSFKNHTSISESLKPYKNRIQAALSRSEEKMWYFKQTIPHLPYILTPTETSLIWSTDKIQMRMRMKEANPKIIPNFVVVNDVDESDPKAMVQYIEKRLKYPVIVKPSGLSSSMLVTNCYHSEELEKALQTVSKHAKNLHKNYKEFYKKDTPQVLVEELMEGEQYSVDGVVNAKGKCFFYPSVHIKTGKQIGFDDYFGYQQITPTLLKQESYEKMIEVTRQGIHALGLRNTHFHAELIKTEAGWKIIEIAPRMGGFRHELYLHSYGMDITENDIRIRLGQSPIIKKARQGYTAALKIFAKKEGIIKQIKGEKKIKEIESVFKVSQFKKAGDRAVFAKHGGRAVFVIMLFNKDRSKLLADIRRIEQELDIVIK